MNQDLKQRVPIGILYVVIIASSFLSGPWSALILMGLFYLISLFEFINIEFGSSKEKIIWLVLNAVFLFSLCFLNHTQDYVIWLALVASILFLINGGILFLQRRSFLIIIPKWLRPILFLSIPFMLGMDELYYYENFRYVILGSFIIIWLNDAGAYFVGKTFGKRKILAAVSPGKSWEGWAGGLIIGVISSVIIAQFYKVMGLEQWILLALALPISGLLGDLTESSWKRYHKIKDSGTILKGHGGFLDRLDSFIYSLPFIIILFELMKWYKN